MSASPLLLRDAVCLDRVAFAAVTVVAVTVVVFTVAAAVGVFFVLVFGALVAFDDDGTGTGFGFLLRVVVVAIFGDFGNCLTDGRVVVVLFLTFDFVVVRVVFVLVAAAGDLRGRPRPRGFDDGDCASRNVETDGDIAGGCCC